MNSVYRWISEHSGLCRILLFLLLMAFTVYAASFEYVSFLSIYLIDLAIWFILGRFIAIAPAKLLREPEQYYQQHCDPHPMKEELERQLSRKFDGSQRQAMEIDYAVALRAIGDYRQAAEILENVNIDKFPGTNPYLKYVYYHNLCDILYVLGRTGEAQVWHRKSCQIYRDLPESKAKQQLTPTHELMAAEIHHYEGRHEDALRKVSLIRLIHPKMVLDGAMLAAKCHIALGEPEKAAEKLNYIITHGNKLYMVEEAKALLDTLS